MIKFKNDGARKLAIPCHGETVVVSPGKTVECDPRKGWLDDDRAEMLKSYGMKISEVKSKGAKPEGEGNK